MPEGLEQTATPVDSTPSMGGGDDVSQMLAEFNAEQAATETTPAGPVQQVPTTPEPAAQTQPAEFEFKARGQTIKLAHNDPRLPQWLGLGYTHAQEAQAFKQQQAELRQIQERITQAESKYKPVDEFFARNPELWQRITSEMQAAQAGVDPTHPLFGTVNELKSQVEEIKAFKQSVETAQQQARIAEEDSQLEAEIQSIRDEFKDLDWQLDEAGKSALEFAVLEHAQRNGIRSFKAAFRDFKHEELIKRAEARALESSVKDRQAATKQGLMAVAKPGQAPKPLQARPAPNLENPKTHADVDALVESLPPELRALLG